MAIEALPELESVSATAAVTAHHEPFLESALAMAAESEMVLPAAFEMALMRQHRLPLKSTLAEMAADRLTTMLEDLAAALILQKNGRDSVADA